MTLCVPISPLGLDHGIICPVLRHLATYNTAILSDDARAMLLRVAAAESELMWLEQHGGGPARSWWQIEPASAQDVLRRAPRGLLEMLVEMAGVSHRNLQRDISETLRWNPFAACALARAYWWLDPHPMPPWQDIEAQGAAYKRYWNTHIGAATVEGFIAKCHETGVEAYIAATFGGQA